MLCLQVAAIGLNVICLHEGIEVQSEALSDCVTTVPGDNGICLRASDSAACCGCCSRSCCCCDHGCCSRSIAHTNYLTNLKF